MPADDPPDYVEKAIKRLRQGRREVRAVLAAWHICKTLARDPTIRAWPPMLALVRQVLEKMPNPGTPTGECSTTNVAKAFASPAINAAQKKRAKCPRKKTSYQKARKLYDDANGAPISNAKRIELEKRIVAACGVEQKTAKDWISSFEDPDTE
jgi:hypothetical protein